MSILSLDQLKRKTGWNDILLEKGAQTFDGKDHPFCIFRLVPRDRSWPSIDLYFDGDIRFLDPVGFSQWHGHYDGRANPRKNLIDALRAVRQLVARELCLVEELGEGDEYRGGSMLSPDGVPDFLGKEVRRLRRVFFDRPPTFEEIDFSRYWEGKHLFVEWKTKNDTEKIWKEHGVPITW